jgi:hypothetical protein
MSKKKRNLFLYAVITLCFFFAGSCSTKSTLTHFFENLDLPQTTTEDLDLKESYEYDNKTIQVSWYSSNEEVISTMGKVTLSDYEQSVILIATATCGNDEMKKTFQVTVEKNSIPDTLSKVANQLMVSSYLTTSVALPKTKKCDGLEVQLEWSCDHPEIMDSLGNITLPNQETQIKITVKISCRGQSMTKDFMSTVPISPEAKPGELWSKADVYQGSIEDATYPEKQTEFAGAVYRKVVSSRDNWLGIEVVVTLPEFIGDEGRTGVNPWGSATDIRYLDNASVYLGGNTRKECDVGLSWSIGSIDAACSRVDYSQSVAYRPFWRYISTKGENLYSNAAWGETQFYYYPGDTVRMSVYSSSDNFLQLRIELLEETKIEKYAKKRASYNLGDNYEKVFTSPEFESSGAGVYKSMFKRVCALDQANNEAHPTQPTNAQSLNTIFKEVYLYRKVNGNVVKVPMTDRYCSGICSPSSTNSLGDFSKAFIISKDGIDPLLGGEVVSICPNNRK